MKAVYKFSSVEVQLCPDSSDSNFFLWKQMMDTLRRTGEAVANHANTSNLLAESVYRLVTAAQGIAMKRDCNCSGSCSLFSRIT